MIKCKYQKQINCVNNFRNAKYGTDEHGLIQKEECKNCELKKGKIKVIK
jgi:hypothetical protein